MEETPKRETSHNVNITGWQPGLQKFKMTKVIQRFTGSLLMPAMDCTDRVLGGEVVVTKLKWKRRRMQVMKVCSSFLTSRCRQTFVSLRYTTAAERQNRWAYP